MIRTRILVSALFAAIFSVAAEQDLLFNADFSVKAGASETRTFTVDTPEHADRLMLVGFNPTQVLSVSCTMRLYDAVNKLLGSYNCMAREAYFLQTPLPVSTRYKAVLDLVNNNFTTERLSFSVLSRFKFVAAE